MNIHAAVDLKWPGLARPNGDPLRLNNSNFVAIDRSGQTFNPHVRTGVATEAYLKEMLAEPFEAFTFSPASAWVYQLGTFGTARKELKALVLQP